MSEVGQMIDLVTVTTKLGDQVTQVGGTVYLVIWLLWQDRWLVPIGRTTFTLNLTAEHVKNTGLAFCFS